MAEKILNRVEITLIGCGENITYINAEDTRDNPTNGKYALDQFKAKEQLHFINENDKECYVPFHAIENIYVSKTTQSVPGRPDPYGCEASNTYSINLYNNGQSEPPTDTLWMEVGDTTTLPNPTGYRCLGYCDKLDEHGFIDWDHSNIQIESPYEFTLTEEIAEMYSTTKEINLYAFCQ